MGRNPSPGPPQWLTVARLVRTQGRRGELAAELLTDFPERLFRRAEVFLWDGQGEPQPVSVESRWTPTWSLTGGKQYLIFKFADCDSRDAARELVGQEVQIPRPETADLPPMSFLTSDLVGCRVVEQATGSVLGRVRQLLRTGGADLLVVATPDGQELLIPFAQEICREIDPGRGFIGVCLPEGLRELNRPPRKGNPSGRIR